MALAVVAIITVGLEPSAPTDDARHQSVTPTALALALGAGVGIGAFFSVLAFAPDDGGLWPVVWARGTSTVLLVAIGVVVALRTASPAIPALVPVRVQAVVAGVLDVGANAVYVLALQSGLLSVVAVLGSLYPAATVLLARLVLAERLRPMQKVGMLTALVASALLALG
jgi:drug/metabolite transporter (DMT)-like permease